MRDCRKKYIYTKRFVFVRNRARKASVKRPFFEGILRSYSLTFNFNAKGASPLNIGIPLKNIIICFAFMFLKQFHSKLKSHL